MSPRDTVTGSATGGDEDRYMSLNELAAALAAAAGQLAAAFSAADDSAFGLADQVQDLAGRLAAATGSGTPGLKGIAREIDGPLLRNRREEAAGADPLDVQALCVVEEAGELAGAYRRWAGKARRTGTLGALEDEVADVLIATAVFAHRAGIDIEEAVARKYRVICSRGWQEEEADQ